MTELKRAILEAAQGEPDFSEPGVAERAFRFDARFLGFAGHFPGYPVLPALVQVMTAATVAEALLAVPLTFASLENAKFHLQIEPGMDVSVRCQERQPPGSRAVDVRVTVARGLASSFRLTFAADGGTG